MSVLVGGVRLEPLVRVQVSGRVWGLAADPSEPYHRKLGIRPPRELAMVVQTMRENAVVAQGSVLTALERSALAVSPELLFEARLAGVDWRSRMVFEQAPLITFFDARVLQNVNLLAPGPSCITAEFATESAHHDFLVVTTERYPVQPPEVVLLEEALAPGCPNSANGRPHVLGRLPWSPLSSLALVVALTAHWLTSYDTWRRSGTWTSLLF